MYDVKITSLQKSYIFKMSEENNKITITRFSYLFECSKVNSKSILDRMVKLGILYKENKSYLFTTLGQNISDDLLKSRDRVKLVIQYLLNLSEKDASKYATYLVCQDMKEFTDEISRYYEHFNYKYNIDDIINYRHLEKLIGAGRFNLCFCIYKIASDKISNGNEFSMANMGFNKKATLVISDNSHIILDAKTIKKGIDGYIKKSIVTNISHVTNNEKTILPMNDGKIKIPLKLLSQWCFIDKNILQCGIYLNTNSKIGFVEHNKKSLFVFTINLFNL